VACLAVSFYTLREREFADYWTGFSETPLRGCPGSLTTYSRPDEPASGVRQWAMAQLAVSTSPRATWLWASDEATARRVKDLLGDQARAAQRARQHLLLVADVGIGVGALTACETLASTGFTFTWHESQHPLDRTGWPTTLPGMLVTPEDG
jgi:hypothetical protein